ncbi:MAG: TlyA family RNA methyltransferase [Actinobacteria bacterium]|nr:TlyA family RNA methyltransferase [Actinomycetota bacterium]
MTSLKKILSEKNPAFSGKSAESLIMSGRVKVDGRIIDKPGAEVPEDAQIEITEDSPYVSRGGLKIENAFKDLGISAEGKKAADVGASTGGFTDFLLKNGAESVTAIDVGYGILSWKLRTDPRVFVFERTNIRKIDASDLPYRADLTVVDVSFISLEKIFDKIIEITEKSGEILLLVKPQFEAKREDVGKGGIVLERQVHKKVLGKIIRMVRDYKLSVEGIAFSKVKGAKGNQEFWIYAKKTGKVLPVKDKSFKGVKKTALNYDKIVSDIVEKAHDFFIGSKKWI